MEYFLFNILQWINIVLWQICENVIYISLQTSSDGTHIEIIGATASSYMLSVADIGYFISVSCEPVRSDWARGPIVLSEQVGPIMPGIMHGRVFTFHNVLLLNMSIILFCLSRWKMNWRANLFTFKSCGHGVKPIIFDIIPKESLFFLEVILNLAAIFYCRTTNMSFTWISWFLGWRNTFKLHCFL